MNEEVLDMGKKKSAQLALLKRAMKEDENPSLKSMRFLYENYQPKYWWFEVFETLRKLSLTGFLVFLAPGTGLQIVIAIMITIFSLMVYVSLKPFQDPYANKLAIVAQCQLLVTIICALAIKVKMDGLQDHQSFDTFLTCLQVIPVSIVTFYFVGKKINSTEEGRASVLPNTLSGFCPFLPHLRQKTSAICLMKQIWALLCYPIVSQFLRNLDGF